MSRILTISNECFSEKTSNGRTLSRLLQQFSPEELAQFYLHGIPDRSVCQQYYSVSDREALDALLLRKQNEKKSAAAERPSLQQPTAAHQTAHLSAFPQTEAEKKAQSGCDEAPHADLALTASLPVRESVPASSHGEQKPVRSCKNLVLRDIVWKSYRWWNKDFSKFLEDFRPEVVLLQAGDSPFMYAIARKIAKKYHAKLAMFNTENYVLKQKLYAGAKEKDIWHRILRHRLRVQYRRFMKKADFCVYNTEWLEEAYQKAYPHPNKSKTLYVSTDLTPKDTAAADRFDVTYCGNLGVGRAAPLLQFAKVLEKALPEGKLHIYGKFNNAQDQSAFLAQPNVEYHGVVPYSEVPGILAASTLVLHCENPKRVENLRYAFSTKIADSLACGRPFLVYASREYPFVQYLAKHDCAHIAADPKELQELLVKCQDFAFCNRTLANAAALARENHSASRNAAEMHRILSNL